MMIFEMATEVRSMKSRVNAFADTHRVIFLSILLLGAETEKKDRGEWDKEYSLAVANSFQWSPLDEIITIITNYFSTA